MTGYRVPLFDKMRERLAQSGVKLTVVYGTPMGSEVSRADQDILPWGVRVPCRYLPVGQSSIVFQRIPRTLLREQDMIIIPHENRMVVSYLQLWRRCSPDARIAFFGHGANFQARRQNSCRERFKSWTARHVDWWFAYTSMSIDRITASGFPANRITCLNNSLDVNSLISWQKSITPDELQALRATIGLRGNKVGIFIGSLYEDKKLDFLFHALDKLRQRSPEFETVLIGDGPLNREVKAFVKARPWAFWVGAKHGREKVLHISLGKVMLNPGLVGLNILDSFALGMPMVTTDCGIHSPEVAYLESGRNGLMVPDNIDAFANAVENLFTDNEVREKMAAACREDVIRYSLDSMVESFCNGISLALGSIRKPKT